MGKSIRGIFLHIQYTSGSKFALQYKNYSFKKLVNQRFGGKNQASAPQYRFFMLPLYKAVCSSSSPFSDTFLVALMPFDLIGNQAHVPKLNSDWIFSPRAHSLQYPWCQSQQENSGHQMLLDLQQIF